MKTGIYTEGREWNPHEPSIFLGVNAEKFHDTITKHANAAVGRAYDATKQYVSKRWYFTAVPFVMALCTTVYAGLMLVKPNVKAEPTVENRRKKTHWDYGVKYYNQGKEKVKEVTDNSDTIDSKVDTEEAKK